MAHDNKVVRLAGQKSSGRFALPSELVRLRDASGQLLKGVLASFFEQADDSLFALADRAASNQDQTAYFDAMRELRLRRKSMTVAVLQYVSQAFNELGSFKPAQTKGSLEEIDQDSLSLVDHSDLEQQVAIDNLTNRLRTTYQEPVRLLSARIRHLVPDVELSDAQMPLGPEVLCNAVSEACTDLDIEIRAKLVVLKLFERLLVDKLSDFYHQCNKTLVAEGVLPDMKRAPVGASASANFQRPKPGPAIPGPESDLGLDEAAGNAPTFSELSALLHQQQVGETRPGVSQGHYIDTRNLMAKLSELQGSMPEQSAGMPVPLRQQLQPVLQSTGGTSLSVGQVDSDVINLVSMLFDFILEDRQLDPVMKVLIGRLQIPVLKVALSDRSFFNRGGHPVRKLLNELAMAAIGWTEKKPGTRDALKDKIEDVVNRVLNEFTDNVALFEELLQDFSRFMDLDRRRRELVEQRLRDAEEGRARQEHASKSASDIINNETAGRAIPDPVLQVFREPLARYLQWIVLREGDSSPRWESAKDLTRRLVWSVDPTPVSADTRSELLRAIPQIVDDLRKALQEISWDPFATDAAIRDLELAHVDVFQRLVTAPVAPSPEEALSEVMPELQGMPADVSGAQPPEPVLTATEAPEPEKNDEKAEARSDTPELPAPEVVQAALSEPGTEPGIADEANLSASDELVAAPSDEWLRKAESLTVGSWVEMLRDESRLRCKLAAVIKATGKYIFVNRSGAKMAEYYRDGLALALQEGSITILDDGLIFDRALESIIDNLRHSRKD
ncbi:DUF1631 domain-containing protein [Marinobacter fuscus]|uniref:DUF1631 domain-containing protein n=1 Tax=Marinobacter fuscus TaxID=2109942 RepID=A0A2T1K575_9GAMM|nr:DUF1631 domain-containing protein [Marinobacter fuscus]PSF05309.1 DUF1631 domain-containing protein [Marinobacter fuscus]